MRSVEVKDRSGRDRSCDPRVRGRAAPAASPLILALVLALASSPAGLAAEGFRGSFPVVHGGRVDLVSVAPDGSLAAFASGDELSVWKVADGSLVARRRFPRAPSALGWASDGSLAVLGPFSPAYLLDPATLATRRVARTGQLGFSAAVAPGGRFALAASSGRAGSAEYMGSSYALVDLETGAATEFRGPHGLSAYALSPDGSLALVGSREEGFGLLSIPDGAVVAFGRGDGPPSGGAFSQDGRVVACVSSGDSGRTAVFRDVVTGGTLGSVAGAFLAPPFAGFVEGAEGDGLQALVLDGYDYALKPVAALDSAGSRFGEPPYPLRRFSRIEVASAAGGIVALGSDQGGVAFMSGDGNAMVRGPEWYEGSSLFAAGPDGVWAVSFGSFMASGTAVRAGSGEPSVAELLSGKRSYGGASRIFARPEAVEAERLRFGAGGTLLLALTERTVAVLEREGGRQLCRFELAEPPLSVDASADGEYVLVSPPDGPSEVRTAREGRLVALLPLPRAYVPGSRGFFAPDGSVAILEPGSSSIVFYEAATGRRLSILALGDALGSGEAPATADRSRVAVPLATGEYALVDLVERTVQRAAWPEWPILAFWLESGRPVFAGVGEGGALVTIDARNGEVLFRFRTDDPVAALLPGAGDFVPWVVFGDADEVWLPEGD